MASSLQSQINDSSVLKEWFGDNHFLVGGLILMLTGVIANSMYHYIRMFWAYLIKKMFVTVRLTSADESFNYILEWIANPHCVENTRDVQIQTTYDDDTNIYAGMRPRVLFVPAEGNHIFEYKGKWLWMSRIKFNNKDMGFRQRIGTSLMENEKIIISTFSRNRSIIEELISDAMNIYFIKDEGNTVVYCSDHGNWQRTCSRQSRALESVVLDEGIMDKLMEDTRNFIASSDWYHTRGIPYRRGYLLYGPPGTGKTSTLLTIAGELGMSISVINLSNPNMNDSDINLLMNIAKPNTIILIEDIDSAFVSRKKSNDNDNNNLTFSGVLNAIDGVFSQEGRMLFMTTNHIERLDPALLRPGRVDVKFKFDYASHNQIRCMFIRMYYDCDYPDDQVDKFVQAIPDRTISPAQLQGYFMQHKNDPLGAIENVKDLKSLS